MKKDLFKDLLSSDIDDRYKEQSRGFEEREQQDEISEQILNRAKLKMNIEWANEVVAFYKNISNNPLLKTNPHKNILDSIYDMAIKIIEDDKQAKLNAKIHEEECKEKERQDLILFYQEKARVIDDKIDELNDRKPSKFWCERVINLKEEVESLDKETLKFLTNKSLLKEMLNKIEKVKMALDFDTQIEFLEAVERDEDWGLKIIDINKNINKHKSNFVQYMINFDKLKLYVELASIIVSNANQDRKAKAEEERLKNKLEKQAVLEQKELEKAERYKERYKIENEKFLEQKEEQKRYKYLLYYREKLINYLKIHNGSPLVIEKDKAGHLLLKKWNDQSVEKLIIPEGIEYILGNPFSKCKKLREIQFPSTLKEISCAFNGNIKLKEVKLTKWLEKIDDFAFSDCKNLVTIYIPSSVKEIGKYIGYNSKKLKEIIVDPDNPHFCSVDGNLYSKDLRTFYHYCVARKDKIFTLPSETVCVKSSAFYNANNLMCVDLHNVQTIEQNIFRDCKKLVRVDMYNVKNKKESISFGCKKLKEINDK